MKILRTGCDANVGWALVYTPASIEAEVESVHTSITNLDNDIARANVSAAFKTSWGRFKAEWMKFYSDLDWMSFTWGSTRTTALDFREKVKTWRDAFVTEGGRTSSPALPDTSSKEPSWNTLMWLGAAAVGTWGAVSLVRAFKQR